MQLCRAVSADFGAKINKKVGNGSKKVGKFCLNPNFFTLLDAKFNVDYDFAIKHKLIL